MMFMWILLVANLAGGEPAQVLIESEEICRAEADSLNAVRINDGPIFAAACVYVGMEDQ